LATGSAGGATGLTCLLIILNMCANLTTMAGSSRQTFPFARDKGVPYHTWVPRVSPGYDAAIVAIMVSATWARVFHCIYIGSALAFNIIMSAGTVSLLTSYMASMGRNDYGGTLLCRQS
jgi:amino acid transporter